MIFPLKNEYFGYYVSIYETRVSHNAYPILNLKINNTPRMKHE